MTKEDLIAKIQDTHFSKAYYCYSENEVWPRDSRDEDWKERFAGYIGYSSYIFRTDLVFFDLWGWAKESLRRRVSKTKGYYVYRYNFLDEREELYWDCFNTLDDKCYLNNTFFKNLCLMSDYNLPFFGKLEEAKEYVRKMFFIEKLRKKLSDENF